MAIETLHDAWRAGARMHFRCTYGSRDGLKSIRECMWRYELDIVTLMVTRGRGCLITDLQRKTRCPMCGSWRVSIGITVPPVPDASRISVLR